MAKNPSTSKIPRIGACSKIPKFGITSKASSSRTKTIEVESVHLAVFRSHSRDTIVPKRKSSHLLKNDFSSHSNLHKPKSVASIAQVRNDENQLIIDDEPIELVGGSVETLSDVADATYEINGTFNVPEISAKNCIHNYSGVTETPNLTFVKPFDGTFDVKKGDKVPTVNDTYDLSQEQTTKKGRGSRLSTDLVEQIRQKGLSPNLGLNSTINHEKGLLDLSDLPLTNQHLLSDTQTLNPINITDALCLPVDSSKINESSENLLDETLVAEQKSIPLASPSNHDPISETPEQPIVLMRDKTKGTIALKQRFSLGLDLSEYIQDCSIELCDMSNASSMPSQNKSSRENTGGKQSSFEMDESLGILTPEQMKEFLDSTKTNTSSHPGHLQLQNLNTQDHRIADRRHQCRVDLTPSPEELPLDPVEVKTDGDSFHNRALDSDMFSNQEMISSIAESEPRTDQMTKSAMSKISNSFIASITSVTSDGYQGDGEMSRPASRAADHSPLNGILNVRENRIGEVVSRRHDPMTDSDFFTESDADDLNHRGDRKAQVIDGTLFGTKMSIVPLNEAPTQQGTMDDMESSGIFTDAENRTDEDMSHRAFIPPTIQPDISPNTETQSSSNTQYTEKKRSSLLLQTTNDLINNVTEDDDKKHENTHTISSHYKNDKNTILDIDNNNTNKQFVVNQSAGDITHVFANTSPSSSSSKEQSRKQLINSQRKLEMTPRSLGNKCKIQKLNSLESEDLSLCSNISNARSRDTQLCDGNNKVRERTKLKSNNKWDAVMNKIAENQKNSGIKKKDFSEVKSKVYCGLTPTRQAGCEGISHSACKKRQLFIAGKQNHADDLDKSSQSDLSLGTKSRIQSTKNNAKQSNSRAKTGAIKKRDVRTIISSPNDIGQTDNPRKPKLDHNLSVGNGHPAENAAKQHINISPKTRASTTISNRTNLPIVASKTLEPVKSPNNVHPHKISQRNATIILESATIIPSQQLTNNNNMTKASKTSSKKTSGTSTPPSPSPSITNNKIIGANHSSSTKKNVHNSVNLKNLKNLSSKIATTAQADDGPNKALLMKKLTTTQQQLVHSNKSVEALGVLMQYLVYNLDAFSCPSIKLANERSQKGLFETTRLLDETRAACQHLEAHLTDRESYFKERETELETKLESAKQNYIELESSATTRIGALEAELAQKEAFYLGELAKVSADSEFRNQVNETKLRTAKDNEQKLTSRLSELTNKVDELTEKAHSNEIEFSERIQSLTVQIEKLRIDAETREQELLFELTKTKDETFVSHRVSPEKSNNASMNTSFSVLQDEVESLRTVLDLKQHEICELRKHNQEMQRAVDEHNALIIKHASAESRLEDLQVQLKCKFEQEQELLDKIKQLEEKYNQEVKTKARLAQHNEELQYRLKQNSEKFSATVSKLTKSFHEQSMHAHDLHNISFRSQPSSEKHCFEIEENSPPTSPVIKGVVEKSDSVSWVLEMDDEAPEVLASRVVRRAGSFRSNLSSSEKCSQSPVPKRQKCQSLTPLQTSASATSILRRNNSERSPQKEFNASLRSRSKSVTIKTQARGAANKKSVTVKNLNMSFHDPRMYTSSPRLDRHVSETDFPEVFIEEPSAFDAALDQQSIEFHRDKTPSFKKSRENRGLITCDTTKLLTNHTTEKKVRKPKISAGEALISGSNSEDDTDTTDESCGLSSTSNENASNCDPREVLSIEDALMKKIEAARSNNEKNNISGSNTPMDVSWSEHIAADESQEPLV